MRKSVECQENTSGGEGQFSPRILEWNAYDHSAHWLKHAPVEMVYLVRDPKKYKEEVRTKYTAIWREAMRFEIESL